AIGLEHLIARIGRGVALSRPVRDRDQLVLKRDDLFVRCRRPIHSATLTTPRRSVGCSPRARPSAGRMLWKNRTMLDAATGSKNRCTPYWSFIAFELRTSAIAGSAKKVTPFVVSRTQSTSSGESLSVTKLPSTTIDSKCFDGLTRSINRERPSNSSTRRSLD